MINLKNHGLFVRLFSSAILMQAVLSASSLAVSLLLIRRTTDSEYGYYVLITNTILLLSQLQNAYIQPSLVYCLTNQANDRLQRSGFVGGLYREQRAILSYLAAAIIVLALVLWMLDVMSIHLFLILVTGAIAALFTLFREFFRMVLLAYRRPDDVLRGDAVYAVLLVLGALAATLLPTPAALMALALSLAALIGGSLQRKSLRAHEMWTIDGNSGALKQILTVGLWATTGAAIHWAFAQGYNYLVAGTLGVASVAALAAIRTLIMPVNLVSTGISSFMFPTVSTWMQQVAPRAVLKRVFLMAGGLVLVASCYLAVVWVFRDWIFANVLKKSFPQQNMLLGLWFAVGIAMLLRDQLLYILVVRARFRLMSAVTLASAILSLTTSYIAMRRYGETGALCGLLLGEIVSVTGLVALSLREVSMPNSDR